MAIGICQHCHEQLELKHYEFRTKDVLHQRWVCTKCGKRTVIWHLARRMIYGEQI